MSSPRIGYGSFSAKETGRFAWGFDFFPVAATRFDNSGSALFARYEVSRRGILRANDAAPLSTSPLTLFAFLFGEIRCAIGHARIAIGA